LHLTVSSDTGVFKSENFLHGDHITFNTRDFLHASQLPPTIG
jgi:hypothetical protein